MSPHLGRRDMLRGAGAAGIAGLAGCIGSITGGGRTIRIGLLMGVTGELSGLGPPIRQGAELCIEQMQDADVPFSIDFQFEDTNSTAEQGISGANALVDAGYPMICGALGSAVTIQVAQNVAIQNEVPMVSPASTAPDITDMDDNGYVNRTCPTDALQGRALADIATDDIGANTAATFYLNQAYGQGVDQGFANSFEDRVGGGQVINRVSFEPGGSSYTSQLRSALEDDPDVLLVVAYPESGGQIFRDFYSEFDREDMPVLVTDGLRDASLPGSVGRSMTNVTGTAPLTAGPGKEFFDERYEERYDEVPDGGFIGYAYDAAAVLLLANAWVGENNGSAIKNNINTVANPRTSGGKVRVEPPDLGQGLRAAEDNTPVNYVGVTSEVDFDSNGDMRAARYEYFGFTEDDELETLREIDLGN